MLFLHRSTHLCEIQSFKHQCLSNQNEDNLSENVNRVRGSTSLQAHKAHIIQASVDCAWTARQKHYSALYATRRHNRWCHCDCQPVTSSIVATSCIKVSKQHHYQWVQRPKCSFILCEKCLLVVIYPGWQNVYCWLIATDSTHSNTVQRRKDTCILQMSWIELKYGFYL